MLFFVPLYHDPQFVLTELIVQVHSQAGRGVLRSV